MAGIKTTPADAAFSNCVRERAEWRCEWPGCNKLYAPPTSGLQCAHFFPRGDWSTRLEPMNCLALCYAHHNYADGHHHEFREFMEKRLGDDYWKLVKINQDVLHGKEIKQTKGIGEIAEYYRDVFESMLLRRSYGQVGRIEFDAFLVG